LLISLSTPKNLKKSLILALLMNKQCYNLAQLNFNEFDLIVDFNEIVDFNLIADSNGMLF